MAKWLLLVIGLVFVVKDVRAQDTAPIIKKIKNTQLHINYNDKPHRYLLELITTKTGDYRYTWENINCGYFVGKKDKEGEHRDKTIEWRYDTPGECVDARVTVKVVGLGNQGQRLSLNVWPPFNPEVKPIGSQPSKVLANLTKEQCASHGLEYNQETKKHQGLGGLLERGYLYVVLKFTSKQYFLAAHERARGKLFDLWERIKACQELYDTQYDNLKNPCDIVSPPKSVDPGEFQQTFGTCIKG